MNEDTLTKFGHVYQTKCISAALKDIRFFEKIVDILKESFFDSDSHKWLITEISAYYRKYKGLPTLEVFKHRLGSSVSDDVLRDSIVSDLRLIYTKLTTEDSVYIKDEFLNFCKNQCLKDALLSSVDLLNKGEFEKIWNVIGTAIKAGTANDDGHDYINDIEARLMDDCRNVISTGFGEIDLLTGGGLGSGELGVIMAPAGRGKSWVLIKLGAEALKQKKNVVHVSLELNDKYVGRRYDAYFTGFDFKNIIEHKDDVRKMIEERDKTNFLKIKYFPTKSISSLGLKSYVDRVQNSTGKKVDLLIVDYADILKPIEASRKSSTYEDGGSIYEELRGIGGELELPVWTASQTNRSSGNAEIIEAEGVADSYKKIMTADLLLSLSRNTTDKLQNTARFHLVKNRFGADGLTFFSDFNASNGDIRLYDKESPEAKIVMSKMRSEDDCERNKMKEVFDKMQSKKAKKKDLSDLG